MKDYNDFPPFKYFLRVLKCCPKSALVYARLWKKRGVQLVIKTNKKDILKDYLVTPTLFRNLMVPLMSLNLVNFTENDDKFQIDILGPSLNDS